jgi:hypothetical protein
MDKTIEEKGSTPMKKLDIQVLKTTLTGAAFILRKKNCPSIYI